MSLLPFFQWSNDLALSVAIRDSVWLFPFIEALHLLALALLGGTVLIVDLRLVGAGLVAHSPAQLAADVRPWMVAALAVMLVSGALMFVSEALRCYDNPPFTVKMIALAVAVAFTFTVKARVTQRADVSGGARRAVAVASLLLWTTVGVMGRGIGFW